jgi:hypothetical protein
MLYRKVLISLRTFFTPSRSVGSSFNLQGPREARIGVNIMIVSVPRTPPQPQGDKQLGRLALSWGGKTPRGRASSIPSHAHARTRTRTHTRTCTHTHKNTHTCTYTHKYITHAHTYVHNRIHTHTHTYVHAHTHTRTHTYAHARTRTRAHARAYACRCSSEGPRIDSHCVY